MFGLRIIHIALSCTPVKLGILKHLYFLYSNSSRRNNIKCRDDGLKVVLKINKQPKKKSLDNRPLLRMMFLYTCTHNRPISLQYTDRHKHDYTYLLHLNARTPHSKYHRFIAFINIYAFSNNYNYEKFTTCKTIVISPGNGS